MKTHGRTLATHVAVLAVVSGPLVLAMSAGAQEKKPIGMLLATGDIAKCLTDAEEKDLVGTDENKKEKARNKSGQATADLIREQIAKAQKKDPSIQTRVLALGDLAYPNGKPFECFDKTWGSFRTLGNPKASPELRVELLPTLGNHDLETKSGETYFTYFKPVLDSLKADPKLITYSVDFPDPSSLSPGQKPWRLFALNSNDVKSPQLKWFSDELSKIKGQQCVLAFSHAFLYSSGRHGHADSKNLKKAKPQNGGKSIDMTMPLLPGNMQKMFEILHANQGSVFLAGHDHHYEQLGPATADGQASDKGAKAISTSGVRSFIVGVGGTTLHSEYQPKDKDKKKKGNDYDDKWAFHEAYDLKSRGILKIMLYPTSYEWEFIPTKKIEGAMKIIKDVKAADCN